MNKETSALVICLLILLAEAFCLRQIFDLWYNEKLSFVSFRGIAIVTSLGFLTIILLRISYLLVRRIVVK